jgi:hypothetical protein
VHTVEDRGEAGVAAERVASGVDAARRVGVLRLAV